MIWKFGLNLYSYFIMELNFLSKVSALRKLWVDERTSRKSSNRQSSSQTFIEI